MSTLDSVLVKSAIVEAIRPRVFLPRPGLSACRIR